MARGVTRMSTMSSRKTPTERGGGPRAAATRLRDLTKLRPTLAIVLGSGFQAAASHLRVEAEIPFVRLPGFPKLSVRGHQGKVLLGFLAGVPVGVLSGRAHFYEGLSMETDAFPI